MRTIYIMSGIPGSGKSTYVSKYAGRDHIILSRDRFRDQLRELYKSEEYYPVPAPEEYEMWADHIKKTLKDNPRRNIWIDQCTSTQRSAEKLLKAISPAFLADDSVCFTVIHTALDQCLKRNALREGFEEVPPSVIRNIHNFQLKDPLQMDALMSLYPGRRFYIAHTNEMEAV